jgi:hypothetical protein
VQVAVRNSVLVVWSDVDVICDSGDTGCCLPKVALAAAAIARRGSISFAFPAGLRAAARHERHKSVTAGNKWRSAEVTKTSSTATLPICCIEASTQSSSEDAMHGCSAVGYWPYVRYSVSHSCLGKGLSTAIGAAAGPQINAPALCVTSTEYGVLVFRCTRTVQMNLDLRRSPGISHQIDGDLATSLATMVANCRNSQVVCNPGGATGRRAKAWGVLQVAGQLESWSLGEAIWSEGVLYVRTP